MSGQCLGSAGCQPAVFGSLPKSPARTSAKRCEIAQQATRARASGKLPDAAGWQPALPSSRAAECRETLALKVLYGFSTAEIPRAFLSSEAAI